MPANKDTDIYGLFEYFWNRDLIKYLVFFIQPGKLKEGTEPGLLLLFVIIESHVNILALS